MWKGFGGSGPGAAGRRLGSEPSRRRPRSLPRAVATGDGALVLLAAACVTAMAAAAVSGIEQTVGYAAAALMLAPLVAGEYPRLIGVLLAVTANIGFLSDYFAIKLPNGESLLELRDLLIVLAVGRGLLAGRERIRGALENGLISLSCWLLLLAPVAAIVGILNGGDRLYILREMFTFLAWSLAPAVAANLATPRAVRWIVRCSVWLGLLMAAGLILEVATNGAVRVVSVSKLELFRGVHRPAADGLLLILGATVILLARFVVEEPRGARKLGQAAMVAVLLAAGMFSQARIMILAIAASAVTLFALLPAAGRTARRLANSIGGILVATTAAAATLWLFGGLFGQASTKAAFLDRYGALTADDQLHGRRIEVAAAAETWSRSPLLGAGLGVPYREALPGWTGDPRTSAHNILAFYAVKMGGLGLVLFLCFCGAGCRSVYRNLVTRKAASSDGVALGLALLSLMLWAQSGNVFGSIQGLPFAAVIGGALAAHDRLAERRKAAPARAMPGRGERPASLAGQGLDLGSQPVRSSG